MNKIFHINDEYGKEITLKIVLNKIHTNHYGIGIIDSKNRYFFEIFSDNNYSLWYDNIKNNNLTFNYDKLYLENDFILFIHINNIQILCENNFSSLKNKYNNNYKIETLVDNLNKFNFF